MQLYVCVHDCVGRSLLLSADVGNGIHTREGTVSVMTGAGHPVIPFTVVEGGEGQGVDAGGGGVSGRCMG